MPKINVLPQQIAELIAAGEVVERPASVIKELVENAVDAGADCITVEIERGGISYIRITDNGCGIDYADVPTAFLRHATSKIKKQDDLAAIGTLGFRGEALAAVCSVSRVELFTKPKDAAFGTHYKIEGGSELLYEEAGCPDGTTILIRDIFFNTPARMKFLKKDVTEANAAAAVVERIALSHPEIAFKLIRDGRQTLVTAGDGKTDGTVYSVLGREFAGTLIPVSATLERVTVSGLTCKPVSCRPTRNYQFTFLNGRLIRSGTVIAAAEQAYKNSAMVGKFPGFVLYLTVPPNTVDVNVHPAKTEVRFSDERRIFDAVYAAVKSALNTRDTRPEVQLREPTFHPFERLKADEYRQQTVGEDKPTAAEQAYAVKPKPSFRANTLHTSARPSFMDHYSTVGANGERVPPATESRAENITEKIVPAEESEKPYTAAVPPPPAPKPRETVSVDIEKVTEDERPPITVIGEAFSTYIIVQMGDSIFIIDKHAAHERILFNDLKKNQKAAVQVLLNPVTAVLPREEYDAVMNNIEALRRAGFEIEDFGNSSVRVLSVPAALTGEDVGSMISELAGGLLKTASAELEKLENLYHTVACRAAIKAGNKTSPLEMQRLAERVLYADDILYCPHGRPVAFEIKKRGLEKQFGRIQ